MEQQQHVLEFSPDGKLFALINEHGILKIWDTETNELVQEYTPNLHLSSPCTCLTWITVNLNKKIKDRGSVTNESSKTFYIAMGTNKGGVAMYSYAAGKIDRHFQGDGHAGRVTAIAYDQSSLLYTVGEDCQVIVWNIYEERRIASWPIHKEKPSSILFLKESENILIGSRQLTLMSIENKEIIQTFTGHTSDVVLLSGFTHNSQDYAISASKMERILCLWTLSRKSKYKNASCTFLMEDIAYCISCKIDTTDGNTLKIVAVTRSGRIHAYEVSMDSIKAEKPFKPIVTIEITSDNSNIVEPLPAIAASMNKEVLFAYGDKNFLVFEQVALNLAEKVQVLIRTDPKELHKKNREAAKLENTLKVVTPFVDPNSVEYKSATVVSKKKAKPVQIPMETRLQNLNLTNGEIPQAQSKVQLLIQALHSKDSNFLTTVLATKDPKVIQLTLQKLPIQYIEGLVNELTLMMQKKRSQVQTASLWMKALIKTHTSQLMALGTSDLIEKFGPCLGIIEHRTNCLKELSKLNGRLHLLINQIKRNTEEEEDFYSENVLVYEDRDSNVSDIEDEGEKESPVDDEWVESESEAEQMDLDKEDEEI